MTFGWKGEIIIVATFNNAAAPMITTAVANTLIWSRDAKGSWQCTKTVLVAYRPRGCEASS